MTDEYPAYQTGHRAGLAHKAVNHAKGYIERLDASVCSGNLLKA
ncbi:MAG: hypothetical protein M2R45_00111 [Verrucomicrobia subdivision 3 bacterium]|nr:hypothetical protein [Limisphaerales bacterium]MCS1412429.1 hypothetical protein [Limisphaerales bacterium]